MSSEPASPSPCNAAAITTAAAGSTFGCALLIVGCCIGAGMLGMPVLTATAGFLPTSAALVICSIFMLVTGLLLVEATLWYPRGANLLSLARQALGCWGQLVVWLCFTFLFYCLSVAYLIGCRDVVGEALRQLGIPAAESIVLLLTAVVVGFLVYCGTRTVDYLNRVLIVGLAASYLLLVAYGAAYVDSAHLSVAHWNATLASMPLLLICFGYQNLVPTITNYLQGNIAKVRKAIFLGIALALGIYLTWELIILGILPPETDTVEAVLNRGEMVTQLLEGVTQIPYIGMLANVFAFFAISTSLLANALTCVDFLHDGLRASRRSYRRWVLCVFVLLPPLLVAQANPNLFLKALSIAGGTATVILFGIIPALIIWFGRYRQGHTTQRLVCGGKPMLVGVLFFSSAILILEICRQLGLPFF